MEFPYEHREQVTVCVDTSGDVSEAVDASRRPSEMVDELCSTSRSVEASDDARTSEPPVVCVTTDAILLLFRH